MRFIFTSSQLHLGDKNFTDKHADTLVPSLDFRIVATGQSTAVKLDAVAGEDEHQDNQ